MAVRVSLRCVYCHDDLGRHDAVFCAACLAPHHARCQREHGRCAAPGCPEHEVVRPRVPGPLFKRRARASRLLSAFFSVGLGVGLGVAAVVTGFAAGVRLAAPGPPETSLPAAPGPTSVAVRLVDEAQPSAEDEAEFERQHRQREKELAEAEAKWLAEREDKAVAPR